MAIIKVSEHQTARLLILEKIYQLLSAIKEKSGGSVEIRLRNLFDLYKDTYYVERALFWKITSHEMLFHTITEKIAMDDEANLSEEEYSVKKVGHVMVYTPIEKSSKYCAIHFRAKLDKAELLKKEIEKLNLAIASEEKITIDKEESKSQNTDSSRPHTVIEKGIGYFKFNKHGLKISIGDRNTRKFRLLQVLCDPINSARTVEGIFEYIKLPKDAKDSAIKSYNEAQSIARKKALIEYQVKELQKIKPFQGKLKFIFDTSKKTYRLVML